MQILKVTSKNQAELEPAIAELEKLATYPLGQDRFKIDHGQDYFAFFRRLGSMHYYCTRVGDQVVAVAMGVIRQVPFRAGQPARKAWYLCDLKVHPEHRGNHYPLTMMRKAFIPCYLRCQRGYAISMNPGDGSPNRVVKLMRRWRWTPLSHAGNLQIFSVAAERMELLEPLLEEHRGKISYRSLAGIKDIVLESTGRPMPLIHVHWGASAEPELDRPQPGHEHMFCAPDGDPLIGALKDRGMLPTASASIIQHGMGDCDWKFVLTSDI